MTIKDLVKILKKLKIPLAYRVFSSPQNLPFMVYYIADTECIYADDGKFKAFKNIVLELYTREKDFELEQRLENLLTENEINFEDDEDYISDEKMFKITYEFTI